MSDPADEILATLKIRPAARNWVKDQQRRIQRIEGQEPTHAEFFDRLASAYMDAHPESIPKSDDPAVPDNNQYYPQKNPDSNVDLIPIELAHSGIATPPEITPAEQVCIDKLLTIIRDGPIQARTAITANLDMFALATIVLRRWLDGSRHSPRGTKAGQDQASSLAEFERHADALRRELAATEECANELRNLGDNVADRKRRSRKSPRQRK